MRKTVLLTGAALLLASVASAATITEARLEGESYTLSADEFTTLSTIFDPRGSVTTSCGAPADGRRAILKCVSDAVPDGRYNPESGQSWIDSADVGLLKWDPVFKGKVKAFGFGITDAADTPTFLQPDPFWRLAVDGATIEHPRLFKDEGEPVTWYTVLFDKPVSTASLLMRTAAGDGFGIINATVAPIPLPAAGWLLLAGVGGLVAARKARKRV